MYAETGIALPYFEDFPLEVEQFDGLYCLRKPNASLEMSGSLIQMSTVSDYNLGGEGDLFKAPEPVIGGEPPLIRLDPLMAAISMICCGDDVISSQLLIDSSTDNGQLLSEVFYECRKDLLAREGGESETPLSEVITIQIPTVKTDETVIVDDKFLAEGPFQKSVSSSCLRSMDAVHKAISKPSFLDCPVLDFGAVYGMRRAFSEGDIKALGNGDVNVIQSPAGQAQMTSSCTPEDRREKLSRYRSKKMKRNFGRKIKYACRKALADSQPRVRGRFAKSDESENSKKSRPW